MVQNMDDVLNDVWSERICFRLGFGRVGNAWLPVIIYRKMSLKIR